MSSRRILLVDDDDGIREVTRVSLETTMGWQVLTASSGDEALRLAGEEGLSAILLDVMMPDMDGAETFARLREREESRDIPVVLLTAKTQKADLANYAEMGVAGTVQKPFDPLSLGREVADALGWED
ncbi:MAG: response regulator [Chloroflexi bacterium]|nr:response regulator [Chloroflexota bacterium]MCH8101646.1 response regulator [Chloroflexota bacterium]